MSKEGQREGGRERGREEGEREGESEGGRGLNCIFDKPKCPTLHWPTVNSFGQCV